MVKDSRVLEKLQREVDEINENYAKHEKIKKIALLPNLWSIDGGELTAKLSLKRKVILQKYQAVVEKMYQE